MSEIRKRAELNMKGQGCKIVDYELYQRMNSNYAWSGFFKNIFILMTGMGLGYLLLLALLL